MTEPVPTERAYTTADVDLVARAVASGSSSYVAPSVARRRAEKILRALAWHGRLVAPGKD